MRAVVKKWGNSAAVRIPRGIMQAAKLQADEAVEIREQDGYIIVERIRPLASDLSSLLAAITPENLHSQIDFGTPAGKELL